MVDDKAFHQTAVDFSEKLFKSCANAKGQFRKVFLVNGDCQYSFMGDPKFAGPHA